MRECAYCGEIMNIDNGVCPECGHNHANEPARVSEESSRPAPGSASLPAGTELERQMTALFEEWWVKDRQPWMYVNKDEARFLFAMAFLAGRESQRKQPAVTPND